MILMIVANSGPTQRLRASSDNERLIRIYVIYASASVYALELEGS